MEQSLVIIKPDGATRRRIGALVLKALLERGYGLKAFREMKVSRSLAEMHYAVHKEKPFFPWLVDFISSAPVLVLIFEADNAIQDIRDALGATFVQKAEPDTLRGKYGIWAGVNIAHASDAPETAAKEIELWTTEGGVVESDDARTEADAYIAKYAGGDIDLTMQIRDTVRTAIAESDKSSNVLDTLIDLFGKDAESIPKENVEALAKAVHDFILEEIEKSE
jgi:nucleoside-diphosphate kinase